jgi:hypothetical protein
VTAKFYDGYHLPAYTYDKTSCGLIDAHQFAADEAALYWNIGIGHEIGDVEKDDEPFKP